MSDNGQGVTTTQGRSESSAKYKIGDKVKFVDEDCCVIGVTETLTGRWRYNIERNGVCIAVGVTENMLDPADDEVQLTGQEKYKVGDEVWVNGELCTISAAHQSKWGGVYTIVCRGRIVMSGASESTMEALLKKETERKLALFTDELERVIKAQECTEEKAIELRVHVEKIRGILTKAGEDAQ